MERDIKPIRNNLIIELHVPDFGTVKKFYGALGFSEIHFELATKEHPAYLVLRKKDFLGDTMINFYGGDDRVFNQSYFRQFPKDTKRGYAVEVTVPTTNVSEFFNKIIKSELKDNVVRELKELNEGGSTWKDFRMEDPFGFYLRFTDLIDWGQ